MKKLLVSLFAIAMCLGSVQFAQADPPRHAYKSHEYKSYGHRGYYHPGHRVQHLPKRHYHFVHDRRDYFYFSGNFFNYHDHYYEVVRPPYGVSVPYLPPGYVSFTYGPSRYFYVNYTYYLWDDHDRDYVVVEPPPGAEDEVVAAAPDSLGEIYAYPAQGQSAKQQDRDYYDCHVWAVSEAKYDPTLEGQDAGRARDYRRAISACLEGRGYSVK